MSSIVFTNGLGFSYHLFLVAQRYGSCQDYAEKSCREACGILHRLIDRLEQDGQNVMVDKDLTFSGHTIVYVEQPLVKRKGWRRCRSSGRWHRILYNSTELVPRRAMTHNSVSHYLWRRFMLHLVAAKKCGSAKCRCWQGSGLDETDCTDAVDPNFVLDTVIL